APAASGDRRGDRRVRGLHRDLARLRRARPVLAGLDRARGPDPATAQRLAAVRAGARSRPGRAGGRSAPAAGPAPPSLTLLDVADLVRLNRELDPLLAGLAERVLGLADVLL